MYAISISFILFLYTTFSTMIISTQYGMKRNKGVYMELNGGSDTISISVFERVLDGELKDYVVSYSWKSKSN